MSYREKLAEIEAAYHSGLISLEQRNVERDATDYEQGERMSSEEMA